MPVTTIKNLIKRVKQFCCFPISVSCILAFLGCQVLMSCNTVYDQTTTLNNGVWSDSTSIAFEFDISDTTILYDLFLEVNHQVNYSYQNIYCTVETFELGQPIRKDLCSLELADSKGNWLGDCQSETCDRRIPFIINTQFNTVGMHKIVLTQHSRQMYLKDINSLRLVVSKTT